MPWLVRLANAIRPVADRSRPLTAEAVRRACEQLILRRDTHLDQLTDKLQEERVHGIIAPLLSGADTPTAFRSDDLQAFLQRIVNSGGRIEREYGLGRMRTDLLIVWPASAPPDGRQRKMVIECKVLHRSLERTISDGLKQTRAYLDRCGAAEGHLVIFDRTPDRPWEQKLFRREPAGAGPPITTWGM